MLLTIGILLWAGLHLSVSLARDTRQVVIDRIGLGPYKGLFSLALILAIVLMVMGWKGMSPAPLYQPPAFLRHVTMLLMPIAVILFIGARFPSNIRHWIRHPQLSGLKLWAVAHLLSNGELRSLILFGGLLAWAVAEVIVLNRRGGPWERPPAAGAAKTVAHVAVGVVLTGVLMFAHPWLSGMPLFSPR